MNQSFCMCEPQEAEAEEKVFNKSKCLLLNEKRTKSRQECCNVCALGSLLFLSVPAVGKWESQSSVVRNYANIKNQATPQAVHSFCSDFSSDVNI